MLQSRAGQSRVRTTSTGAAQQQPRTGSVTIIQSFGTCGGATQEFGTGRCTVTVLLGTGRIAPGVVQSWTGRIKRAVNHEGTVVKTTVAAAAAVGLHAVLVQHAGAADVRMMQSKDGGGTRGGMMAWTFISVAVLAMTTMLMILRVVVDAVPGRSNIIYPTINTVAAIKRSFTKTFPPATT